MLRSLKYRIFFTFLVIFTSGCGSKPGDDVPLTGKLPVIHPDYSDITIPPNIAPLNFIIRENGSTYFVKISSGNNPAINIKSKNGIIKIPQKKWAELLAGAKGSELNID
ncbi:MAG: cytochrome biosynthesis protein, partial [Bacteroidetes bacterium]|nr:cytochrome biosynthesis protein [Bacteroidota bacterium]